MMNSKKSGSPAPEHNPKLKMAAKEITDILVKYDIAGIVDLHTPGFKEIVIRLDPSYSCVSIDGFRKLKIIKPMVTTEEGSEAAANKKIADTINMLANFQMVCTQLVTVFNQAIVSTRMSFGMMDKPGPPPPPSLNGRKQ